MEITRENLHVNIGASRVKTFLGIMLSSLSSVLVNKCEFFFTGSLLLKSVTTFLF